LTLTTVEGHLCWWRSERIIIYNAFNGTQIDPPRLGTQLKASSLPAVINLAFSRQSKLFSTRYRAIAIEFRRRRYTRYAVNRQRRRRGNDDWPARDR